MDVFGDRMDHHSIGCPVSVYLIHSLSFDNALHDFTSLVELCKLIKVCFAAALLMEGLVSQDCLHWMTCAHDVYCCSQLEYRVLTRMLEWVGEGQVQQGGLHETIGF